MTSIQEYQTMVSDALDREKEAVEREKRSQKKLDDLLAALGRGAQAGDDNEEVAAVKRAEKIAKLELSMRKSVKVKDFKEGQETITVKEWLSKFHDEMLACKRMSGIRNDLTREEIVVLFKDKLDYAVIKRFDSAFAARDVPITWAAVTYKQLKEIMKQEYEPKICDVSEVLLQFGPGRMRKSPSTSVAKFTHQWNEQLPDCMCPSSNAENAEFADLIKRTLFTLCLDDPELQKELCELKGADMNFKKYFGAACEAEQRRKSLDEIGSSGAKLDGTNGVSVNKWETFGNKNNYKKSSSGYSSGNVPGSSHNNGGNSNNSGGSSGPGGNNGSSGSSNNSGGNYKQFGGGKNGHKNVGNNGGGVKKFNKFGGGSDNDSNKNNSSRAASGRYPSNDDTADGGGSRTNFYSRYSNGERDDAKNGVGKKRGCYRCGRNGHYAKQCYAKLAVKQCDVEEVQSNVPDNAFLFNSMEIVAADDDVRGSRIDLKATSVASKYATCPPIMTKVEIEGIPECIYECDTAASHNIMSSTLYKKLKCSKPERIPDVKPERLVIRLADGSTSRKLCGSIKVMVKSGSSEAQLNMFVMDGPNNLLGRLALEQLWPKQYAELKEAVKNMVSCEVQVSSMHEASVEADDVISGSDSEATQDGSRHTESSSSPAEATTALPENKTLPTFPKKRVIPAFPEGNITQAEGEAICEMICNTYPEVFDNEKGYFRGTEATMFIKDGHLDKMKQKGVRPPVKVPYGLEAEYNKKLDELLEDCVPIDGSEVIIASQVVPVCTSGKDGTKKIKRLAVNYKNTVNDHLEDVYSVPTSCGEQLDKLRGEYRSCIDLKGAFKQIPVTPGLSQNILTVVTPRGYFAPTRMQFG